jgi:hypothetical protein
LVLAPLGPLQIGNGFASGWVTAVSVRALYWANALGTSAKSARKTAPFMNSPPVRCRLRARLIWNNDDVKRCAPAAAFSKSEAKPARTSRSWTNVNSDLRE